MIDGDAEISVIGAGDGVIVETVQRTDERIGVAGAPADRFAALAWAEAPPASLVTLVGTPEPVTVTVNGPGVGLTALVHLQLRVAQLGEAVVVLDYRGSGTLADNLEVRARRSASRLTLVVIDDLAAGGVHVSAQHMLVGRDATLRATTVSLGGDLVRVSPTVRWSRRSGMAMPSWPG